jgi:DNA repair protein RecN (Recombination protein N)
MITHLRINNFILAENVSLDFSEKLNIISGETGAGKSIIIGAINIILGKKIKTGILRDKNKKAILEATFNIENNEEVKLLMERFDFELEENEEIFITREITPNYKSRIFINGRRVTNVIVKEFREKLLDSHSQRDQIMLFNKEYQLGLIDNFGSLNIYHEDFRKTYSELKNLIGKRDKLIERDKFVEDKINLYKYQMNEIEGASLKIGEDKELENELDLLTNSEDLINITEEMKQQFYESDTAIYDQLKIYYNKLSGFNLENEYLKEILSKLENVLEEIQEISTICDYFENTIDRDSQRLMEVQNRFNFINEIKLKYKLEIEEILQYYLQIKKEITSFYSLTDEIEFLNNKIEKLEQTVIVKAEKLSKERIKSAKKLEQEIEKNIKLLSIPYAKFKVEFDELKNSVPITNRLKNIGNSGKDSIEFLFAANQGLDLQPLKNAVSGGELSRLLLSIKKITAEKLSEKTFVFDEIDSGIGGKTADYVANFIKEISRYHQIICITHLPQIASKGDKHFLISKEQRESLTEVKVNHIKDFSREKEIARMLSGLITETAINHAKELLKK